MLAGSYVLWAVLTAHKAIRYSRSSMRIVVDNLPFTIYLLKPKTDGVLLVNAVTRAIEFLMCMNKDGSMVSKQEHRIIRNIHFADRIAIVVLFRCEESEAR